MDGVNSRDLSSAIRLVHEAGELATDDVVASRLALAESTLEEIVDIESDVLRSELLQDAVHHVNVAIRTGSSEVRVPARNASQLLILVIDSDCPSPSDFENREVGA